MNWWLSTLRGTIDLQFGLMTRLEADCVLLIMSARWQPGEPKSTGLHNTTPRNGGSCFIVHQ